MDIEKVLRDFIKDNHINPVEAYLSYALLNLAPNDQPIWDDNSVVREYQNQDEEDTVEFLVQKVLPVLKKHFSNYVTEEDSEEESEFWIWQELNNLLAGFELGYEGVYPTVQEWAQEQVSDCSYDNYEVGQYTEFNVEGYIEHRRALETLFTYPTPYDEVYVFTV